MTYGLALKLLQNEKLTSALTDKTAIILSYLRAQLRVFILAFLPRLGGVMGWMKCQLAKPMAMILQLR